MTGCNTNQDIFLVEGFAKVLDFNGELIEGKEAIEAYAWRRRFQRAWKIDMRAGKYIKFLSKSTANVPKTGDVIIVLSIGIGVDSDMPEPTGEFSIELSGKKLISFCSTNISRCWQHGNCKFYYEIKNHRKNITLGIAYLLVPASELEGMDKAELTIRASDTNSARFFMLCDYSEGCLAKGISFSEPNATATYMDDGIKAVLAGPDREICDEYQLCWGDLHVHSNMANYIKASPEDNFEYARYVSQLDFIAITDQEHFLTKESFKQVIKNANDYYAPGEFVTFIGFEYSSRLFGHRNVIFKGDSGILVERHDIEQPCKPPYPQENRQSFEKLCNTLKKSDFECMLLPHHPSITAMGSFNWSVLDSELETAVEIYSCWGSSEYLNAPGRSVNTDQKRGCFMQDALNKGLRLGIIASGESGDGHPGNSQWRRNYARNAGMALTPLGGGLAGVWAKELTREGIFDAIKQRRCYGATNARIALSFKVNGYWMGQEIPVSQSQVKSGVRVNIDFKIKATNQIDGIYLFKNGKVVKYITGYDTEMSDFICDELKLTDFLEVNNKFFTYYYIRVNQVDGHMAWSSPVWFNVK